MQTARLLETGCLLSRQIELHGLGLYAETWCWRNALLLRLGRRLCWALRWRLRWAWRSRRAELARRSRARRIDRACSKSTLTGRACWRPNRPRIVADHHPVGGWVVPELPLVVVRLFLPDQNSRLGTRALDADDPAPAKGLSAAK